MTFARLRAVIGRWAAGLLPVLILLGASALQALDPPVLEEFRLRAFDAFQRLHPRSYEDVPVRIVDLDDDTLAQFGQWPWPRTLVAELIRRTSELGAAVVAFDIVFAEPDRTSPTQILPLWPKTPELETVREAIRALPDHDQALAEAMGAATVVTGFSLTAEPNDRRPAIKAGFAFAGDDPHQYVFGFFQGAVANLDLLEAAASGNGHFNMLPDRDAIIRRVPLLLRLGDTLYPSLAAEALRAAQGASTYVVKSSGASGEASFGQHTGIAKIKIGRFEIPTDAHGRVWVYYTARTATRVIPAWRVLEDQVEAGALDGAVVFIGTSAAGLKDLRATPMNAAAAGVEIHAQMVEQVLTQAFLQRPDWARGAELVYLLLLGLILLLLLPRAGAAACAWLGGGAIALALGLSWYAYTRLRWLLDPVSPSLATFLIYLVGSTLNFLRTEAERRQVRQAFSRYISPALADRVAKHPEQLKLGGETKSMTILFSDIRGFTTLAEGLSAEQLTRFMNRFLTPMTGVILERFGTIDKYIGDCIMAFWNAPLDDPEHARHACEAALEMRRHLVVLNQQLKAEHEAEGTPVVPINIGIGMNTGLCSVGNFGSEQRFDYSVLGDSVNLASRLEGQSKTYGTDIVIGPETREAVGDLACLELDLIRVVGKAKPVRIFAILGDAAFAADAQVAALRAAHAGMLAAYRAQRWDDAERLAGECLTLDTPATRLRKFYTLYRDRIHAYRAHSPGAEWDGVFVAVTK